MRLPETSFCAPFGAFALSRAYSEAGAEAEADVESVAGASLACQVAPCPSTAHPYTTGSFLQRGDASGRAA